jgi:hypothetical protein
MVGIAQQNRRLLGLRWVTMRREHVDPNDIPNDIPNHIIVIV